VENVTYVCDLRFLGLHRRLLTGHHEYFTWNKFIPTALFYILMKGITLIESLK